MKKVLALVVAFALCFTAFAGCLVTSAADPALTVTVDNTAVTNDGGNAVVTVAGSYTDHYVQLLTVTVPFAEGVTVANGTAYNPETPDAEFDYIATVEGTNTVIKFVDVYTAAFEYVINVAAPAGENTYTVNASAEFAAWDATTNEDIKTATASGDIVVPAAAPEVPEGPDVDTKLVVAGAAVGFGDNSLQVNFRVRKTVIQLYDRVDLVIAPQKYDLTTLNLADPQETVVTLAVGGTFTTYLYTDIQLYELGLNIDYMLKAYDAEDNLVAVSENFSTSAASYLKSAFASSSDSKFRTLCVDTLVVGQESVEMMAASYPDSDLAAAPSIIEGFDISEASVEYGTPNTVDVFNSIDANFATATSATHRVMKSVTIGKVPYIGFRVKDAKSALDASKISFSVSYTSLKLDGSTQLFSKTFDKTNTTFSKSGQFITFSFDEIGLGDSDKDLAIEMYYDGTKVCDMTYSIETYLSGMTSNASVGEIAVALLKLGNAFRAYATK